MTKDQVLELLLGGRDRPFPYPMEPKEGARVITEEYLCHLMPTLRAELEEILEEWVSALRTEAINNYRDEEW